MLDVRGGGVGPPFGQARTGEAGAVGWEGGRAVAVALRKSVVGNAVEWFEEQRRELRARHEEKVEVKPFASALTPIAISLDATRRSGNDGSALPAGSMARPVVS